MNRDQWAQYALDQLRHALDNDLLSEEQLRAILAVLGPVVERAKHQAEHGGPTTAEIESN